MKYAVMQYGDGDPDWVIGVIEADDELAGLRKVLASEWLFKESYRADARTSGGGKTAMVSLRIEFYLQKVEDIM